MMRKTPLSGSIPCFRCQLRLLYTPRCRPAFLAPSCFIQRQTSRANHIATSITKAQKEQAVSGNEKRIHEKDVALVDTEASSQIINEDIEDGELPEEAENGSQTADDDGINAEDIWNSLMEETRNPTEEDLFQNIDELRPTDEATVTNASFQKLVKALTDGFTSPQLLAYIRVHRKPLNLPAVYPWEVRRKPWIPDGRLGHTSGSSNALLRGYVKPSMKPKEKQAIQLVRECWGLSILELMEAPGRLDVAVQELEFALLVAGAQTWLQDISTAFSTVTTTTATTSRSRSRSHSRSQVRLHRHIELLHDQQVLRVVAPAATADAILAEIHAKLSQQTTKSFKLSEVAAPDSIDTQVLRAVGALTSSWARLSEADMGSEGHDEAEVLVSWIASTDPDQHLENTGDMVYRLLLQVYGPSSLPQESKLDYETTKKPHARFFAELDDSSRDKWLWADRQGSWARLVAPSKARHHDADRDKTLRAPNAHSLPIELVLPDLEPLAEDVDAEPGDDAPSNVQKWYRRNLTSTVATFGHLLHAQSPSEAHMLSERIPRLPQLKRLDRILSPVVPPLLGINLASGAAAEGADKSSQAPPTISTTLLLRFLPKRNTKMTACAPPLEVYMDVPALDTLAPAAPRPVFSSLNTLRAMHVSDVICPTEPVDVRIAQQRFFAMTEADLGRDDSWSEVQPLLSFLEQSHLQLDGRPLVTPPQLLQLGLPARVLLPVGIGAKLREEPRKRHEIVPLDYLFAGLEVRRRVATAFGGWTLALTSVDAGRSGGRRIELTVEAVPTGGEDAKHTNATFRQAVKNVLLGEQIKWLLPEREVIC